MLIRMMLINVHMGAYIAAQCRVVQYGIRRNHRYVKGEQPKGDDMNAMPPRFAITSDEINTVVASFYARIRADDTLGPVFFKTLPPNKEIWDEHEEKIASFWRNAILFERSYSGNPQRVHAERPAVMPEHFSLWLALFDEVLSEELTAEQTNAWSTLAHRIGQGLRMGVVQSKQRVGGVPDFG